MVVLWKDYGAARIELGSLDGQAVEDLLLAVLGGPVDTVSLRQLAERSLGDPLFLHELVAGALENGSLREEGGVWRLHGPLQPNARLVELVATRLGHLSEPERHALELTALGEPLAQPALDRLADAEAIESLEKRGLIISRMDGRRLQVCPAHPVYGDVVRSGINPRRQRLLGRELAEASAGRRQDDTLLRASLRLGGGDGSSDLLVAGARAARERRDYALAERMARAAIDDGEGFEARLLAADAAHMSGRHEQAASEVDGLASLAAGTSERVQVSLLRFDHEFFLYGTTDMTAIDALLATDLDPVWRDELLARRLCLDGLTRGPRAVIDAVEPIAETLGAPRTSMHALLGGCLTRAGRMQQALAFLVPPSGATVRQGSTVLSEPWSPFGNHVLALIGLGRLGEAEGLLAAAQQELSVHDVSQERAIIAASLAALRLEQGRVQAAFLQATSAAAVFLDLSMPLCARWCEALSAHALALAGVAPKANQTLAALDALGLPTDLRYEVEVLQARAWALGGQWRHGHGAQEPPGGGRTGPGDGRSARGHPGLARDGAHGSGPAGGRRNGSPGVEGGRRARRGPSLLHNRRRRQGQSGARRGGRPVRGAGCAPLRSRGPGRVSCPSPARRVEPRRRGDAADGRSASRPLRRRRHAVRARRRARAQLTPAELDTALQAATGNTDKQIAEMMHLSVRTVENRLHRAYQKLGLSHRRELAEALRDLPGI